ncbi:PspC domain-containing protein [Streptosporangium sandarakinum]|uniref:PspC domain-containing protein n=1 Tax=Streptosporangium sandarakinum TaxID=1260955 RepID=UPI003416E85B
MHRSANHKILAGVCGGIADSLGVPPTLIRVLWLILSLFPGPMWVAYVLLWIFMPKAPSARY